MAVDFFGMAAGEAVLLGRGGDTWFNFLRHGGQANSGQIVVLIRLAPIIRQFGPFGAVRNRQRVSTRWKLIDLDTIWPIQ